MLREFSNSSHAVEENKGIYTAELVSEVRKAANLGCDLFGFLIFS